MAAMRTSYCLGFTGQFEASGSAALAMTRLIPEMLQVISEIRAFACGTCNWASRENNSRRSSDKSRLCRATDRRPRVRFGRHAPTTLVEKTRRVAKETLGVGG